MPSFIARLLARIRRWDSSSSHFTASDRVAESPKASTFPTANASVRIVLGNETGSYYDIRVTKFADALEKSAAVSTAVTHISDISFHIVRTQDETHLCGLSQVFQHFGFGNLLREVLPD